MRARGFTAVLIATFFASVAIASAEYVPTIPVPPLPADAVAVVESTPILKQAFDKAYDAQARFAGKQTAKQRAAARAVVLTSLINAVRTRIEANSLGIVVSEADVRDRFAALKAQSFPTDRDYRQFLDESGQVEADLLELVRTAMYEERLRESWTESAVVSDQEVLAEYNAHPLRYSIPESRDLRIIFTPRRASAYKAVKALKRGQSFRRVARKYSTDSSARHGGVFPGVVEEQLPPKLDRAVFRAGLGKLVGPIKTQYGYYVFRVTRIHKPRLIPFEKLQKRIREVLLEQKRAALAKAAQASFNLRWKPATLCRTGYTAKVCGAYAG